MLLQKNFHEFALELIGQRVRSITGANSSLEPFKTPAGDPGLFGPESMVWRVHANFTAMLAGGLSSLMVQCLHPRALAAVWDHSNFRTRLKDRLEKTSYFVAATTYGGHAMAMQAIERVNRIHANIKGIDLQGHPYVANEPELIKWIHLVEVSSFLTAYQHLSITPLNQAQCDGYIAEMTQVGHLLGAVDLPVTWAQTLAACNRYDDQLCYDERAKEVYKVIENFPTDRFNRPFMKWLLRASYDLMPAMALAKIGRKQSCQLQQQVTRGALQVASQPIQWMLDQQGVSAVSLQRVRANAASIEQRYGRQMTS